MCRTEVNGQRHMRGIEREVKGHLSGVKSDRLERVPLVLRMLCDG
jgi:hypothetical protein